MKAVYIKHFSGISKKGTPYNSITFGRYAKTKDGQAYFKEFTKFTDSPLPLCDKLSFGDVVELVFGSAGYDRVPELIDVKQTNVLGPYKTMRELYD